MPRLRDRRSVVQKEPCPEFSVKTAENYEHGQLEIFWEMTIFMINLNFLVSLR